LIQFDDKINLMKKFGKSVLIVLAALLVVVLVGPFLVPVPPLTDTVPPEQLAEADSQFIEINGLTVHVKTMGEGEPIFVLLHGFGASLFSWHVVMQPLSQYGMVIAYDRPAFGLTERPMEWTGQNPYSPQASVDLLLGLLDHFNVQKATLVGNSAGGTVAMQFQLQHPERVQALILVDPAVYEGGGSSWVRVLGKTPQMQHLGPLFVRSIQKSGLDLIKTAWHDPAKITQETWDGYTRPLKADNWDRALWYFTLASQTGNLPEQLSRFTLPVLVISGDDDRIVPTAQSVRLAGELPDATLVVIKDAGHVPHEEQPAAFMQAVDDFLHQTLNIER
jgi:pimeloyl-ACP methyl ester carboxylesterase